MKISGLDRSKIPQLILQFVAKIAREAESILIKYRINFINLEAFKTDHRSEITLFKTAKFPVV